MDVVMGMEEFKKELKTWQFENPDAPEVVHLAIDSYIKDLDNSIEVIQKCPDIDSVNSN